MININEINDPRISHYRSLRNISIRQDSSPLFIAEGQKVTEKLLHSRLEIQSIFALPEYYEKYWDLIEKKQIPADMQFTTDKELMSEIVGFKLHTGIMALARKPENVPLESLSPPIVILNGIIDSENVGSIVRNCAAFGVNSLIRDKETSDPYLRRAVRVSMGAVFNMNVHCSNDFPKTIRELKESGYTVIAAEITVDSVSIKDFIFPAKSAIVFGSEGSGIVKEILDLCNNIIHIPISSEIPSLNVAASSAIILHKLSSNNI